MPGSESPGNSEHNDDFFNNPMRRLSDGEAGKSNRNTEENDGGNNDTVPRPKRIACILCRKRKLRCDGNRPSCGTCTRLSHDCEYSEERKKSGPKRGYVKLLEQRLKQVENLLESREVTDSTQPDPGQVPLADKISTPVSNMPGGGDTMMQGVIADQGYTEQAIPNMAEFNLGGNDEFSWEMIGLGLEEALPGQDVVDELNQIYFEKIHPSIPMIHRARFLASMDLAPHMRPAVCLRYAMWTHACMITPKYAAYTEHFYARARKYAEQDEMRGHGESITTVAHCQCWTLLAGHEFKLMYFPRAWLSVGRAARLAQMMGLHRQDRVGLDVKQTLPPPRDWTDREERRRTFWMAYCQDRYASIGTGWPMTIDEQDILTNLPASEKAFKQCQPEPTQALSEVLNGDGLTSLSSFAGVILMATMYGRNLTHLHRPHEKDNDHDLNGEFWKRHRSLDNILLNLSLSMPGDLRLPAGISDPNTIFLNMNIHTATICLHQAAIFKSDKSHLPAQISAESKRRCIVAADQITNIMKIISHLDLSLMNPFLAFCLYVASRVFVQYLKSRREDGAVKSSLHFLLAAMQVLKIKNPLTESFLVQLDVDLEGSGLDIPTNQSRYRFGHRPLGEIPANTDTMKCSPLFEIRESQSLGQTEREPGSRWQSTTSSPPHATTNIPYNNPFDAPQTNDCAKPTTEQPHMHLSSFDGVDGPYGATQSIMTANTSPNFPQSDDPSSRSHSNQPTPSTTSNRTSSFAGYTPEQVQSSTAYGMAPTTQSDPYGIGMVGMQNIASSNPTNLTAGYNFGGGIGREQSIAHHHASSEARNQQQQQQTQQPDSSGYGSGTGMTPGATGMTPLPDSLWQMQDNNDWMFG